MFQFPRFTLLKLCIHFRIHGVSHVSSLIRKSPDHRLCAPTRSLSQLITSFIGSWCQGIHHAPFVAWPFFVSLFLRITASPAHSMYSHTKVCSVHSMLGSLYFLNPTPLSSLRYLFELLRRLRIPCTHIPKVCSAHSILGSLYFSSLT